MVALKVTSEKVPSALEPPSSHRRTDRIWKRFDPVMERLDEFLANDAWPLPDTADREGYYGPDHFAYWMSGARDYLECRKYIDRLEVEPKAVLDLGAATGRVARHFAAQLPGSEVWCADINLDHVRWVNKFLAPAVRAFQNTSVPHLPFEDNTFDVVTGFSLFSHIEAFDHAWILEVRRVLKPGGLMIFTANVDNWQDVDESWPAYKAVSRHPLFQEEWIGRPMDTDRRVFRWNNSGSYSSIVFLTEEYVRREWAILMELVAVHPYFTQYQTGVVLRKPA
jgi:SAM-dependent methyltransferase